MKILLSLIAIAILFSTASLSFATSDTAPSVPLNVNYTIVDNAIVLTWDKPLEGELNHYQVAYQHYKHDVNPKHIEVITDTFVLIDDLVHGGLYIITVTAYNDFGNAKTDELNVTIPPKSDEDYDEDVTCNERDNRFKDKCEVIENEIENHRLDTLEKENAKLEQEIIELKSTAAPIGQNEMFESISRDLYKQKWIDDFNEKYYSTNYSINSTKVMMGEITLYDEIQLVIGENKIQLDAAQTAYDAFFLKYPGYDPSIEDLTQPDSIYNPEYDRTNYSYNHVNRQLESLIQKESNYVAFQNEIPDDLFILGMEPFTVAWSTLE